MRKIRRFYGILIGLVILSSCSSDDDIDIIVGEWQAIQQFESDISVELTPVLECVYTTFTADNKVFGDYITSTDLPDDCNNIFFEIGTWTNIGNNQYRLEFPSGQDQIHLFYKDGENLVEELPNGNTRIIYKPYE
jgi:hypothetical protein